MRVGSLIVGIVSVLAPSGCGRTPIDRVIVGGDGGIVSNTGGIRGTGGANSGSGGTAVSCAEPVPCEGYDNGRDAHLAAAITCLSPTPTPANAPLTLSIYGHHLATGPRDYAIVTLDTHALVNGVPVTACHLEAQFPADQIASPGRFAVVVSPGSWIEASAPAWLEIE